MRFFHTVGVALSDNIRKENERLQILEHLRKPTPSELPLLAKEWVKQMWYANGAAFCARDPVTGEPEREGWVGKYDVICTYHEVHSQFIHIAAEFEDDIVPVLHAVVQEGEPFYPTLWKLGKVRAEGCIPTRVQQLVDKSGRIIQFGYEFAGRLVISEGDEDSDQLLDNLITSVQATS
ncbi:hypothetical protein BKA70DRAFT_1242512 [Coprinopsis sp. MPI-PUGE-AT-0042]|nr:hypothetical protein BKA70DRAFT_1242512 [Coprinopsis sp. MPI-PUGE-AT-0042]